jgi:Protein of unknown function (DUF1059)
MAKIINCECGFVTRGASDGELVTNVQEHIAKDHPEMVGHYEPAELLALAEEE